MKCSKCKTENGYVRLETKDWVCRKCGKISPIKFIEKTPHQKEQDVYVQEEKKASKVDLKRRYDWRND